MSSLLAEYVNACTQHISSRSLLLSFRVHVTMEQLEY